VLPGQPADTVALPAPQVHDGLTVAVDRTGRTDRLASGELVGEDLGNRAESRRDIALDRLRPHRHTPRHRDHHRRDLATCHDP
jgi:hypothetical protein